MTGPDPVVVHLHHAMTGSYPLRLVDVLFFADRLCTVEYGVLTGVDLLTGAPERRARAFATTLHEEGLDAALAAADRERTVPYADLDAVRLYDGGPLGREKVVVEPSEARPLHLRVHADLDAAAFVEALRSTLDPYDATVDHRAGGGLELRRRLGRLVSR